MTRQHHMRCKRNMVLDYSVMADVITAPQHNVVADRCEWLDRIVFEYETVVADHSSREHSCFGADVTDQLITLLLDLAINRFPQLVHPARRHRREKPEV